jgi:GNAT superfamily N-acetyltransferase
MIREKRFIVQINPDQVTPQFRSLFTPSDPASLRLFAVLDGDARGRIFADHPENPSWGVAQEAAFGSLYLGGKIHSARLRRLVAHLCLEGDVLIGLWPSDPRLRLLPPAPDYSGFTLDFSSRQPAPALELLPAVPEGCELRRMELPLLDRCAGKGLYLAMYGSAEQALEKGYGLCLTNHHELLCEAFAGPAALGSIEIGTETHPDHRRKGYAMLTCAHLIHEMEQQGYRTYWNCAKQNQASIALARKLGYGKEKEYRLLAWLKKDARHEDRISV